MTSPNCIVSYRPHFLRLIYSSFRSEHGTLNFLIPTTPALCFRSTRSFICQPTNCRTLLLQLLLALTFRFILLYRVAIMYTTVQYSHTITSLHCIVLYFFHYYRYRYYYYYLLIPSSTWHLLLSDHSFNTLQ